MQRNPADDDDVSRLVDSRPTTPSPSSTPSASSSASSASSATSWTALLPWLATAGRLLLGGVWIAAGWGKVTDLAASVRAVRAYELLPETAAQIVGAALPFAEIALGVLLVAGVATRVCSAVSGMMLLAFIIGISSAWARGLRIDCGCFGSGGELGAGVQPSYGWELLRDGGLLLVAVLLVLRPLSRFSVDGFLTGPATADDELAQTETSDTQDDTTVRTDQ